MNKSPICLALCLALATAANAQNDMQDVEIALQPVADRSDLADDFMPQNYGCW